MSDRTFDRAVTDWLESGSDRTPPPAIDAVLLAVKTTPQERDLRIPWRLPNMSGLQRVIVAIATVVVVLVGGVIILRPPAGPGAPPSPTPSSAPTVSPAATAANAACRLITSEEVQATMTIPALGAVPGASGTGAMTSCIYSTGGSDIVLRVTYTNPGGRAAFDAVKATAGMQPVTDVGAEAVYDPAAEIMYMVKGDALVELASASFVDDHLAAETQLAKLVVGRI